VNEATLSEEVTTSREADTFADARPKYQSLVFAFVSRRIKPIEDAEDVTSEVFWEAFRHWKRCKGERRLWLLGIARRKIADAYRKRPKYLQLYEGEAKAESGLKDFESAAMAREAYRILMRLPSDERDAMSMQIIEQMSIEEIAEILGRSHAATNSLLERARKRVARLATWPSAGDESK
jgi:RNA polymerase sigma-70 factor (ECF subfamily)